MQTSRNRRHRLTAVAMVAVIGLSVNGLTADASGVHRPQSLGVPAAALTTPTSSLPDTVCASPCNVFARPGSATFGLTSVNFWGFTFDVGPAPGRLAGYIDTSGPTPVVKNTIIMNTSSALTLTLHNDLPLGTGNLSLEFPAITAVVPDGVGVAPGGTTSYTLPAGLAPGTYVYEAGGTAAQARQLSMGLSGIIIVRPADYRSTATPTVVPVTITMPAHTDANAVTAIASGSLVIDPDVLATDVGATVTGDGIPAGATILSVNAGADFTMSDVATADSAPVVSVTITPAPRTDPNAGTVFGSPIVTDPGALATDAGAKVTGPGIPASATISSAAAGTSFTMSAPATATSEIPVAKSAYGSLSGAFADEALVVATELDPLFTGSATPSDVEDYNPQYFFINGKAHPATDDIAVNPNDSVLLRVANLGIRDRAIGLLNLRMTVIGDDSHQVTSSHQTGTIESKLLTPGQVADVTTIVSPATVGTQFAVLDLSRHLNNSATAGVGGMLTFIDVVSGTTPTGGPVAKVTGLSLATNDGTRNEVITYTIAGTTSGANWYLDTLGGACTGAATTGVGTLTLTLTPAQLSAGPCMPFFTTADHVIWIQPFNGATQGTPSGDVFTLALRGPTVSALVSDPQFTSGTTLNKVGDNPPGDPRVIITGAAEPSLLDYSIDSAQLCLTDPLLQNPCLTPITIVAPRTDGPLSWLAGALTISDTAAVTSDVGSTVAGDGIAGGATIVAVSNHVSFTMSLAATLPETNTSVTIAPIPGEVPGTVGDPVAPSTTSALEFVIPPATLTALGDGLHVLYVRAHEVPTAGGLARWSDWGAANSTTDPANVVVVVDRSGPSVTIDTANTAVYAGAGNYPGNLNFLESVRLQVNITDTYSPIADSELFLDSHTDPITNVELAGTGAQLRPLSGQWLDDLTVHSRTAYIDVPVSELLSRNQGDVSVYVHAKDAAGNWGAYTLYVLHLDKTNPVIRSAFDAHNYQTTPDETLTPVLTGGTISVTACDPDGVVANANCPLPTGTALLLPPNTAVSSGIGGIRYHVNAVTGVIGAPGAGIFYQTAQDGVINPANVTVNGDGTTTITFDWHEVLQPPLPPDGAVSVFIWVLDGAGNPSQFFEVPVGPLP